MTTRTDGPEIGEAAAGTLRVDKWLWFARVVKSRTSAAGLVTDGKVRINRVRCEKASQTVRPGDVVTVSVGSRVRVLEISALGERRGPAPEARTLYRDLTPPPVRDPGAEPAGLRSRGSGRPTKRDRRLLEKLTKSEE